MDELWITVPNWAKFQHYKERSPSWIKVYTDLNSRADWLGLTCGQRGLLVTSWLEYARATRQLDTKNLRRLTSKGDARHFRAHLEALNHAGFLLFSASPEKERDINSAPLAIEEEKTPDALQMIRELSARVGRR